MSTIEAHRWLEEVGATVNYRWVQHTTHGDKLGVRIFVPLVPNSIEAIAPSFLEAVIQARAKVRGAVPEPCKHCGH